jgi:hypothetical protein
MYYKKSLALAISLSALFGCGADGNKTNNPRNPFGDGPAAVSLSVGGGTLSPTDLGSAGNYVILAKAGISNVTGSNITGSIGASPVAASYITGFVMTADASNVFSTAPSVSGKIYAANYASPTPSNLTTSIGTIETAYTDAAGRNPPDQIELATGNLGGLTLAPGLYKWTSTVSIPTDVTLSGTATDVWIMQIAGNLTMASAITVHLIGGAKPQNIFWQVAGEVSFGANSHFEGIILGKKGVSLLNQASMNGRIYAQTAVTLDDNVITEP